MAQVPFEGLDLAPLSHTPVYGHNAHGVQVGHHTLPEKSIRP